MECWGQMIEEGRKARDSFGLRRELVRWPWDLSQSVSSQSLRRLGYERTEKLTSEQLGGGLKVVRHFARVAVHGGSCMSLLQICCTSETDCEQHSDDTEEHGKGCRYTAACFVIFGS